MRVKILDFGVAKFMANDLYLLQTTGTGHIIGTPFYMSPEQCGGNGVDPRSDVYSLGCVMYQMLTGRVPFCGNLIDVVFGHRQKQAPPIPHYNPEVPQGLVELIERMMAKAPHQRPPSMAQVESALATAALGAPAQPPVPRDPSSELLARSRDSRARGNMYDTLDSMPGTSQPGSGPIARPQAPYAPPIYGARSWLMVPVILVLLGAAGVSIWLASAL